jgi:hypothetical protein
MRTPLLNKFFFVFSLRTGCKSAAAFVLLAGIIGALTTFLISPSIIIYDHNWMDLVVLGENLFLFIQ